MPWLKAREGLVHRVSKGGLGSNMLEVYGFCFVFKSVFCVFHCRFFGGFSWFSRVIVRFVCGFIDFFGFLVFVLF